MEYEKEDLSRLYIPPSTAIQLPVETRLQTLPFGQLRWQDFERLCHRLVRLESAVEYSKPYGEPGEAQAGIDIFARLAGSAKYRVYQCKNEQNFGPAKIKSAVVEFIEGEWRQKSELFVLCTRESLQSTARAEAVEAQAKDLRRYGVSFQPWDSKELCSRLKSHPVIVDDFFGRGWVKAFCGEEAANNLGERLDSNQLQKLRSELLLLYSRIFNIHDRGVPIPDVLPLYDRYVVADIESVEIIEAPPSGPEMASRRTGDSPREDTTGVEAHTQRKPGRTYSQRLPITAWIVRGKRSLLFGEPGVGKSAFLRFVALDLLHEAPSQTQVARHWGDHIPIWIPFALWTKVIASGQPANSSIKAIVQSCLQSWDAGHLIPLALEALKGKRLLLLLDGLDEHSSIEAAQIALNHLHSFLEMHDIPVIATTRPHGFERLGMNREDWRSATIADLSPPKQNDLARLWFRAATNKTNPSLGEKECVKHIEKQTDNFFAELSRSSDLRELAQNPLLLCLLISFQIENIRLPVRRFDAYAELTNHLISTHPQKRRVASETPSQEDLTKDDVKKMLAYLAANLQEKHPEGLISESDALAAMQQFAENEDHGFGVPKHEAARMARTLIERAEHDFGILVKKSQDEVGFYHRTLQEYLASLHISRLEIGEQLQLVAQHCNDPLWREVVLGLFQISPRPADVEQLVQKIRETKTARSELQVREELLSEVAFGSFNCSPKLARELAHATIRQIETGTWMTHRERLLKYALDGLRSPATSGIVKEKLSGWFPDRCGWNASLLFKAIGDWEPDKDVIETLFKGLNAEEYHIKRAAGHALAKLSHGCQLIRSRLETIANRSDDPYMVAAATVSLLDEWLSHPPLKKIVERCRTSVLPELQIVGIRGRIALGVHDDNDLVDLLKLAAPRSPSMHGVQEDVIDAFLQGWPGNEKIKQTCLESVQRTPYHGSYHHEPKIEGEIALSVLLAGYPMDQEVASFCVEQIQNERYPFLMILGVGPFNLLAKNFRDHPQIVEVLDEWAEKAEHLDWKIPAAAAVGRTETFKRRLLEILKKSSVPHWSARALLEIWGISDTEVSSMLNDFISDPRKASKIGHLLPKIIPVKEESRRYLLQLLKNPECERPDFVLGGLVELGANGQDQEVIVAVLTLLAEERAAVFRDNVKATLIVHFADSPEVRDLAIETLKGRNDVYPAVAQAFGSDHAIRGSVLRLVNPLPVRLRQVIASYLAYSGMDEATAMTLLKSYDHETSAEVKAESAIGYYTRFERTDENVKDALDDLAKMIVCVGPDHQERRVAAFCGLVILDRLDTMDSIKEYGDKKLSIKIVGGLGENIPSVRFVLKHWEKLQKHFTDEFWQRLFGSESGAYFWDKLATFADEYPIPRQEALDFYARQQTKVAGSSGLLFLARILPASPLLLEYCLNTLGLAISASSVPSYANTSRNITARDYLTAAQVMGRHFKEDGDIPRRLYEKRRNFHFDQLLLVLSEGWPRSEELDQCFQEMATSRDTYWDSTVFRYCCFKAPAVAMYKELRKLIRTWSSRPEYRLHEAFVSPIVLRLQHDKALRDILIRHISSIGTPAEKVSMCSLLRKSIGLTPKLRAWAEAELEKQSAAEGIESGLDVTTGDGVSVPHAIYELLRA